MPSAFRPGKEGGNMDSQPGRFNGYRVEVSGWDASDNFFVEKTFLIWCDDEKKEVQLRCPLRQDSVIFVRLVQPPAYSGNFPIAYQVSWVGPQGSDGRSRVYLAHLRPRPNRREPSERPDDLIHVA
jgi:hypothetical protein